jgi:hypothetical protein
MSDRHCRILSPEAPAICLGPLARLSPANHGSLWTECGPEGRGRTLSWKVLRRAGLNPDLWLAALAAPRKDRGLQAN